MSPPGDRPEETAEQIRQAWNLVHSAPPPGDVPGEVSVPPLEKPDRSLMDPVLLDRVTARQRVEELRRRSRDQRRRWKALRIDRWLQFALLLLIGVALAGGVFWGLKTWKLRQSRDLSLAPVLAPAPLAPSSSDRALKMLQAFLAAPDAAAKSAYVLDAARVKPLMEAAYEAGVLPEAALSLGVPQRLDGNVVTVPAQVSGPAEFLLHLMIREVDGVPLLDWETYEQEMAQRFPAFAGNPGSPAAEFRLVVERAHAFDPIVAGPLTVRVAAPGSPALVSPLAVHAEAAAGMSDALPWNRPRRALVRLEWESRPDVPPRMILRQLVRWEFLP
ncbi:MAG: hypothetical protein V4675_02745 [Verrucomicrobiota bacterium]